ncbi:MAG: cell division protein FtsL [Pseudomonadota bacterium]
MNKHLIALLVLMIIAIAGWAYNVNYNTLTTLDRVAELRTKIAEQRESIQVLRVEWAYLNAPDRLARLVEEHNDQLGLAPLTPEALQHAAVVPYLKPGEALSESLTSSLVSEFGPRQRGGIPIPAPRPTGIQF